MGSSSAVFACCSLRYNSYFICILVLSGVFLFIHAGLLPYFLIFLHIRMSFLCLKNAVLETQPGFLSLFARQSTIPQDPAKTCSSKSKGHQSTIHLAHFTHNFKLHSLIVPAGKAAIHCQIPCQVFLVCNKASRASPTDDLSSSPQTVLLANPLTTGCSIPVIYCIPPHFCIPNNIMFYSYVRTPNSSFFLLHVFVYKHLKTDDKPYCSHRGSTRT